MKKHPEVFEARKVGNMTNNKQAIDPQVIEKFKDILRKAVSLAEDGAYSKAIMLLEETLKEAQKLSYVQPEVDVSCALGILHWKNNSFEKFLELTATSLATARVHNYKRGTAESLLNLAWVLAMEKKDFMKAFDFTEEALDVTQDIGYVKGIATSLYIISAAYKHKKMKKKADYFLEKSLTISMSLAEETDLLVPSKAGLTEEEKDGLKGALDLL
jgi:tetratricopeptide (TPR) repeat protein